MLCRGFARFTTFRCFSTVQTPLNPFPPHPISIWLQNLPKSQSISHCKQIHAHLIISQAISQPHIANTILHIFLSSSHLRYAYHLFDQMPHKNIVAWTTMISAQTHHRNFTAALQLFIQMIKSNELPNQHTLSITIRACTDLNCLEFGLQIHGMIICIGLERDGFAGSSLVDLYCKAGGLIHDAYCVFRGLLKRDTVSWNVMISGFSERDYKTQTFKLFSEMQVVGGLKPNDFTIASLLKCCCELEEVEQIHGVALKFGIEVGGILVDLYCEFGSDCLGRKVFDSMRVKDCFVWRSMISGYAKKGSGDESVILFREMCRQGLKPNEHTVSSTLKACFECGNVEIAIQAHSMMIKNGYERQCYAASVLLTIYIKIEDILKAEMLFREICDKDIVAWNSMILGYAQHQVEEGSMRLFHELRQTTLLKPDSATFVAVLVSCRYHVSGIQIHGMITKSNHSCDTRVSNSVISMYSKYGAAGDAYKAFTDVVSKNEVSWSCIIAHYQHHGFKLEVLKFYKQMMADGMPCTNFSLPSCMASCSGLMSIDSGKQLHCVAIKIGLDGDVYVASSIIDMYSKCGEMVDSKKTFDEQKDPNEAAANALISGFGQHGRGIEAIEMFKKMEKMGLVPNQVTFQIIISACSHAGLVEESLFFFDLMRSKYKMKPESEHYSCLVDALGRAGRFEEAEVIIERDGSIESWKTLLGACGNYGNAKTARKAAKKVMELDPTNHVSYLMLSNLYCREENWEEALDVRREMANVGVKKDPGNSWLVFKERA